MMGKLNNSKILFKSLVSLKHLKKRRIILYRLGRAARKNRKKTFDKYAIAGSFYEKKLRIIDFFIFYSKLENKTNIYLKILSFFLFFIKSYIHYNGLKKIKNTRKLKTLLNSTRIKRKFFQFFFKI